MEDQTAKDLTEALNRFCNVIESIDAAQSPLDYLYKQRSEFSSSITKFSNAIKEHTIALKSFRP